jgi:elongation factor P--(R)-beta-lysine ligase
MSLESKLKILKDRALMLKKVRAFFNNKKILEVDPPSLIKHPSIDEHIESISADPANNTTGFLHTSPEYTMKRLIAKGLKNIYFLGHVFRKNEIGQNHNVEFTMIEWYKSNTAYEKFIQENINLVKLFFSIKKIIKISYFDLFFKTFELNIFECTKEDLLTKSKTKKLNFSNEKNLTKDDLLNLFMDYFFEKKAKKDVLYILYDFPQSMAALAKVEKKGNYFVAQRFEFFFNGLEIANGYFELNDEKILRERFNSVINNKKNLTLDENFLKTINNLGSCFGIAIGFDRLMMLRHYSKNISKIMPFSFPEI